MDIIEKQARLLPEPWRDSFRRFVSGEDVPPEFLELVASQPVLQSAVEAVYQNQIAAFEVLLRGKR